MGEPSKRGQRGKRAGRAFGLALLGAIASLACGCVKGCGSSRSGDGQGSGAIASSSSQAAASTSSQVTGSQVGSQVTPGASLLGGERGLDHVGIAVKNLDAATHAYHDVLGFNRPSPGKLPNGIQNVNYYFADATYLETLVYWDRAKADWLASFTDKHSGVLFAVLSAYSPETSARYLAGRGIQVSAPFSGTIQTAGEDAMPEEKWQTFFLPDGVLPGDARSVYFIAYKRGPRDEFLQQLEDRKARSMFFHKNTALGMRAVWFAVPDLAAATKAYESIGLPKLRSFKEPTLAADGQIFGAGEGQLWLMAPSSEGVVSAFLRERGGPGILGVTLVAGNVQTAAKVISEKAGVDLPMYDGLGGKSIRVGPELSQGVWMEFAQQ